jgi:hypothetical protein
VSFDPDVGEFIALQNENHRLQTVINDQRVYRWHATYNAALTGILSGILKGGDVPLEIRDVAHRGAALLADQTHGELAK